MLKQVQSPVLKYRICGAAPLSLALSPCGGEGKDGAALP